MVLIVSPNLCLDRIVVVPGFTAGTVQRAASAAELASGKGLNVARVAAALGLPVRVVGILGGGHQGDAVVRGARFHGIPLDAVRVDGPARVCTLIIDPGRAETVINEAGPPVSEEALRTFRDRIGAGLEGARAVVLAGSLPPGIPAEFYADLIRQIRGLPLLLDATGEALRVGIAARPAIVKANQLELQDAVGRAVDTGEALAGAAAALRSATGGMVLITRGSRGALLCTTEATWELLPPAVERVNTIGAGDSLTAGFIAGLLDGASAQEAARLGVAAAAADVTTLLPGTVDRETLRRLLPQVQARRFPEGPQVRVW